MNERSKITIIIILSLLIAFSIGYLSKEGTQNIIRTRLRTEKTPVYIENGENIAVRTIEIPAVSKNQGISGEITTILKNGSGMITLDISNLLIKEDTENSIRKAVNYAFDYAGKDLNNHNAIYHVEVDAPAIEGSSAGASLAIATIAALENETINNSVMMTGTIHHDGSIGPADGIIPKGNAAKRAGKNLFLVPHTLSKIKNTTKSEYCDIYGGNEFCSMEYTSRILDVENETGIKVKEVKNISEAANYFF